jgi:hypothetical protein
VALVGELALVEAGPVPVGQVVVGELAVVEPAEGRDLEREAVVVLELVVGVDPERGAVA